MKQELDGYIKGLASQIKELQAKHDAAVAFRAELSGAPVAKSKGRGAAPKKAAKKAVGGGNVKHRGAGYVALVLPFLEKQGPTEAAKVYEHLKTLPGMDNVGYNSFLSTLATEIKKGDKSRIVKQSPGVYDIRVQQAMPADTSATAEPVGASTTQTPF